VYGAHPPATQYLVTPTDTQTPVISSYTPTGPRP